MNDELKRAFRYHMRDDRPAVYYAQGFRGGFWPERGMGLAVEALARAREDVAAGIRRYPGPIRSKYRASESDGLRFVGRVVPETDLGREWDTRGNCGWFTDPHGDVFKDGTGLCFGVVYQLPGRKGESRFVAGYEFGGVDGGPTLDWSEVFTEPRGSDSYWISYGDKDDIDTLRAAARHADKLAKAAAETEREYQTAWQAGSQWAGLGEVIEDNRKEALRLLAERRAARDTLDRFSFPTLCAAIREKVRDQLDAIREARAEREELAAGDHGTLIFWPGDDRLKDAFCEGAGLDEYPA